ncbi:hypothetical protein PM10SUCC1_28510 [Propionigenium maris DSM 9537]|uniref:HTH cro/C1-type domain-containing protein n=1 Tax=Propionigenium maris DSM 9537 TaxID=1123000 RepID=A0A9W6GN14_9FUSO|nr:helix-turn-helix transcriptional regulator [Propionigenium maris]GLI57337.1 hypothetical protein PM10SUCC1_28510 [Propionigenium maris DSM 9537]
MSLSKVVKDRLSEINMTQSELSKRLGVTRQHVWNSLERWENGHTPTVKTIKKWAKVLDIDYLNLISNL